MRAIRMHSANAAEPLEWSIRVGVVAPGRFGDLIEARRDRFAAVRELDCVDVALKRAAVARR